MPLYFKKSQISVIFFHYYINFRFTRFRAVFIRLPRLRWYLSQVDTHIMLSMILSNLLSEHLFKFRFDERIHFLTIPMRSSPNGMQFLRLVPLCVCPQCVLIMNDRIVQRMNHYELPRWDLIQIRIRVNRSVESNLLRVVQSPGSNRIFYSISARADSNHTSCFRVKCACNDGKPSKINLN